MDYAYPRWYNPDLGSRSRETEARYTQRPGEPQPPDLSVWPYQYPQSYTPFSYTAVPPGPGRVDFNEDHTFNTSASYDHVPANPPFASMAQFGRPDMSMREAQWLSPPDVTAERPSWDGRNLRGSLGDLGSKRPFPLNPTSSSDPSSSSVKASDRPASDTSPPQPKSTTSNRPTPELKPSQTQGRGNFRSSPTLTKKLDELKSIEVEFRRLQSAYRPPRWCVCMPL